MAKRGKRKTVKRSKRTVRPKKVRKTRKTKKIVMPKKKKRSTAGFVLALIALIILAINVIFVFAMPGFIANQVIEAGAAIGEGFFNAIFTYALLWLILAIVGLMLMLLYEKKKTNAWWLMLILGIITLVTYRIFVGILFIVAAFCYKRALV